MVITTRTGYTGLIGNPVSHSLSPILHNRIYDRMGRDMAYLAHDLSPEDLGDGVRGLKALGYMGFNVTIPHKESIIEHLDEVDPMAGAIGAVNTVKNVEGRLIGYNTDGLGFMHSLKPFNIKFNNKRVAILGAGGAARAIGISLVHENPCGIIIINRNQNRAARLSRDINKYAGYNLSSIKRSIPSHVDMIINTTPLGMWPYIDGNPLEGYELNPGTVVCDVVYNPLETSMLRQARERGCIAVNGLGMLIGQGIKAIEIWTGISIDSSIVSWITDELIGYMEGNSYK